MTPLPVCRHMDIGVGVCYGHTTPISMTGVILASAMQTLVDKRPTAVDFNLVIGGCGHVGILTASTAKLFVEKRRAIRLSDSFVGVFGGTIITGSSTFLSN
jgi:hypothetical protein